MKKEKTNNWLKLSEKERYEKLLTIEDEDIDCSDIPELDEDFFKKAKFLVEREQGTKKVSIRLSNKVLRWFKSHANKKGYQTSINEVLETYVSHQEEKGN